MRIIRTSAGLMAAAALALSLLLLAGCGGDDSVDSSAFEKPIREYLKQNSMDLRVSDFKEVKINKDGTAAAKVALEQADGMVGVKVRWTFHFAKSADGQGWVVTRHEEK